MPILLGNTTLIFDVNTFVQTCMGMNVKNTSGCQWWFCVPLTHLARKSLAGLRTKHNSHTHTHTLDSGTII